MKSHTKSQSVSTGAQNRRSSPKSLAIFVALLAALSISGCTGVTGAGTPAANSNTTSSGSLAASATTLTFGNVSPGASSSQTLTLTNTASTTVTISQATVTGAGFSVVGGMSSVAIAAGQNHAFQIQFAPQAAGSVSGSVSIASNAPNSPLALSLSGTGITGPSVTTQPAGQTVASGATATFTVAATGTGTITYQWKKNGTTISGATSSSYTTPATTAADNGTSFTVTVTDTTGSVTSAVGTLVVSATPVAPSITAQPAGRTVTAGQTATFSVTATGNATLTYQWKKNGAAISGATAASYTTAAAAASDSGTSFTVTVTNSVGSVTSSAATLTVTAATALLSASTSSLSFSSVNLGSSSILGVTFTNTGTSNVTVSGVSISGAGYTAGGVSTGLILTPAQTATLNVTFTPAATGSLPGSVSVASNATNTPATISLSGTGVQPVAHSVTVSWTASSSTMSGYNVYRSTVSGGPYSKLDSTLIATTSYSDTTVQSGQTYFYVVTSVDSSGNESIFSTEVSATIP